MAKGLPTSLSYIKNTQKPLKFHEDGTFKILHLTDIHEVDPEMDDDENPQIPVKKSLETIHVIETLVERTQPDLVVFGGDNISGFWEEFTYDYMYKTIKKIIAPIEKRNIPLAICFGNHDSEGEETHPFKRRENQICIYAEYDNFRSSMNDEDITGCANCSIPVYSADGKKISWNIFCVDSNDYIRDENHRMVKGAGYGYIHPDQIEWYEKKSAELKAQNGGEHVPAILFQHIPVLQEFDMMKDVPETDENSIEYRGRHIALDEKYVLDGVMRENPCPPKEHREQFESWKKTGNLVAAFFGHDHTNTFVTELDGIKLIQSLGAGYHTYGLERGGRLITLKENSKDFDTETLSVEKITDIPVG